MNIISGKKKYEKGVAHVIDRAVIHIDDVIRRMRLIKEKEGDPLACMKGLGSPYKPISSKNFLIDNDIEKCRLNCYIYSKLCIMGSPERAYFGSGYATQMFEMLLCNSPDFIKFLDNNFDALTYRRRRDTISNEYGHLYLSATALHALRGDFKEVIGRCDRYLEKPLKHPGYKYREYDFEFLKALARRDTRKMREMIDAMLEPKVARKMVYDTNVFYDFYLHLHVIIYAKIALHNGMDLGIDCEVAPKELIDNAPLKEYPEPYEFMKGFDLGKITPEEWREWIYRWHPDPEGLRSSEERGYPV